ncbi:WAP four-disulfide core domain protein 8-like isoform 2-T2 [Mantella aurantiaca]
MSQVTGVLLILCLYSTAVISDIYKETSYYGDKVKSGTCPVPPERCPKPPRLDGVCTKDSQCPGEKKCCVRACEYACLDPQNVVKSGSCPHVGPPGTKIGIVCTSINTTACTNDVDCKGQQKCCNVLCTNKCRDPVDVSAIVKSGTCPVPPERCLLPPKLDGVCTKDSQCPGEEKCCVHACEYACLDLKNIEKSGYCPHVGPPGTMLYKCFSVNKTACKNDGDCKGRQKCCSEACINKCRDPVAKPILVPAKP